MEAWTTFLYSFPLWIYLYSIVWLKKENKENTILLSSDSLFSAPTTVHPNLLQHTFSRVFSFVAGVSKHFYFRQCLQNTLRSSLKERLLPQEKEKINRRWGDIQADVCWIFPMALCLQRTFPKEEGGFLVSFWIKQRDFHFVITRHSFEINRSG